VFVHGFGGHATGTWLRMHEIAVENPALNRCDIVFYGYDSMRHRAPIHAVHFRDFMAEFTGAMRGVDEYADSPRYDRIVVAAHSLGAPVVREAILTAFRARTPWVMATRLICFAPAHRGAAIQKLVATASGQGLRSILYSLSLSHVPVLQDLDPECAFIKELHHDYAVSMPTPAAPPLLAAKVIFGDVDTIVEPYRFHIDEAFDAWPGHDHTSVCKASDTFRQPLDVVVGALS